MAIINIFSVFKMANVCVLHIIGYGVHAVCVFICLLRCCLLKCVPLMWFDVATIVGCIVTTFAPDLNELTHTHTRINRTI